MKKAPFLIAANWKMFKSPKDVASYLESLKEKDLGLNNKTLIFFAPAINLPATASGCKNTAWGWGPQNTHFEDEGAYTGETSPAVVAQLGATHGLVGHSERRQLFGETGEVCGKKIKALLRHKLIPVFCIGETLAQRQAGATLSTLEQQLNEGLSELAGDVVFHVAYEPVWAIGTGEVASLEQVAEAHSFIRQYLEERFSRSTEIAILYGGSVKPNNSGALSQVDEVGGFLIGSAALKTESFVEIVEASQP